MEDGDKDYILKQLDLRLREAEDSTRKLRSLAQERPDIRIDTKTLSKIDGKEEREERILELRELADEKKQLEK